MKKLIFIILLPFSIYNCSSDDDITINGNDYLIFGHFHGFCIGEECIETYKLTSEKLYKDLNDSYSETNFDFNELENNKFEQVKDLINYFPPDLLGENETIFGCPDCADQGSLFIQLSKNGIIKSWRIDQSKNDVPSYLYHFMDKINEKINLIHK